ncbi:hypothetical protein XCR_3838 [Xanthomonas campestris pv. raphani 756C]|nr:hypothetical protein XCR_3838 [Xanthomonas campestris pv. raphani 756C]
MPSQRASVEEAAGKRHVSEVMLVYHLRDGLLSFRPCPAIAAAARTSRPSM